MKEKAPIKSASLKFEKQTPERQERLRQWLAVQGNYTESIFSLIEHMIDRFGYVDVKDHEVSKRLYLEQMTFNQNQVVVSPPATMQRATEANELPVTSDEPEPKMSESINPQNETNPKENTNRTTPITKQRSKRNLDVGSFVVKADENK